MYEEGKMYNQAGEEVDTFDPATETVIQEVFTTIIPADPAIAADPYEVVCEYDNGSKDVRLREGAEDREVLITFKRVAPLQAPVATSSAILAGVASMSDEEKAQLLELLKGGTTND